MNGTGNAAKGQRENARLPCEPVCRQQVQGTE